MDKQAQRSFGKFIQALMEKYLQRDNRKWVVLLLASTLALIWRLTDLVYEEITGVYGITRGGFVLLGTGAAILELVIILACVIGMWIAIKHLVRKRPTDHSG
ncbi:MAG: hypothetical protein PVF08_00625 [Gammaproteobacteria bacterium]